MSLKAELETWAAALAAYDAEDFERALDMFSRIADSSKILTNMGLIYATLGEHEAAVEQFQAATQLDQYLAVAYFQCGVSNFLLGRYELSLRDFDEALLYLRGNQAINYEQLGLKFKLFSAEVLFNHGLSLIYMDRVDEGLQDMQEARAQKATDEHNVIDDAITDRGEGYTVFSIPVGVLYRPSENKLKNAKTKDYMGKAKLIAASTTDEAYTEFTGVRRARTFGSVPDTSAPAETGASLSRSQTVPPPRNPVDDLTPSRAAAGVQRARTLRENAPNAGLAATAVSMDDSVIERGRQPGGLQRSNTSGMSRGPQGEGGMAPVRGLSVRKPGPGAGPGVRQPMSPPRATGPPPPEKEMRGGAVANGNGPRLTEIYDNYMGGYGDGDAPPVPAPAPNANGGTGRVAAWARSNAVPPSRAPSAYAASTVGGSMRRRPTRRPTVGGGSMSGRGRGSAAMSTYEEEEEGYVSGEYDETYELAKIRVKLHYQDDMRGMTMAPDAQWAEFLDRVAAKFNSTPDALSMKFLDEDGGRVSLRDDSDFELAIETAREMAKGRAEGKLQVWVSDV